MRDIHAGIERGVPRQAGAWEISLPILYRRMDAFFALYSASAPAVRSLLPSQRLQPLPLWRGRTVVALNAFNYLETDLGPYGEFSVGVPCLVRQEGRFLFGVYIHRLPVTTEVALEAGRVLWGYPKFLCQMEFKNTSAEHAVRLSHDGQLILSMRIERAGFTFPLGRTLNTFTLKEGRLLQTALSFQGVLRLSMQGLAHLELGEHEMGRELSQLALGRRPLTVGEILDLKTVLPEGQDVGPG